MGMALFGQRSGGWEVLPGTSVMVPLFRNGVYRALSVA